MGSTGKIAPRIGWVVLAAESRLLFAVDISQEAELVPFVGNLLMTPYQHNKQGKPNGCNQHCRTSSRPPERCPYPCCYGYKKPYPQPRKSIESALPLPGKLFIF